MLLVHKKPIYAFDFISKENSEEMIVDKKSKLSLSAGQAGRQKIYWICQSAGWLLYALFSLLIDLAYIANPYPKIIIILLISVFGLLSTHVLKNLIKKRNWLNLPLKKIIPRVLISGFSIGILLYAFSFGANVLISTDYLDSFRWIAPVVGVTTLSGVVIIWILIYFSVHYFENYKRVEIESLIWEAAVKDFELKTLKSQLNPHFMFNALNSIRALIKEDPASAQEAITKLSNILRYSLRFEKDETVPLEDEMQTVSDYLALETIRFEERLKYEIKIDPKSVRVGIPPMMIQTLVENGIKHGISKRTQGGHISICSRVEDSRLHIEIRNNGNIEDDAVKKAKGFGINNTKHRLSLLFGEEASFSIRNSSSEEVIAEIIIPTGGVKNESFNSR
jgi:two-component system, LytTR family, sensor kinase